MTSRSRVLRDPVFLVWVGALFSAGACARTSAQLQEPIIITRDGAAGAVAGEQASDARTHPEPIVGVWEFSQDVPHRLDLIATFESDGSLFFVSSTAPSLLPAGVMFSPCKNTETYVGTYSLATANGVNTLSWTFVSGMVNAVTGCQDPSINALGAPATPEDATASAETGDIPLWFVTYTVGPTTLTLGEPGSNRDGIGRGDGGATLTKLP